MSSYGIVMNNLEMALFVMLGSTLSEATNRELAANTATGIKAKQGEKVEGEVRKKKNAKEEGKEGKASNKEGKK